MTQGVVTASRKRDMSLTQVRCCHQAGGCCHSFEEEGYEFDSGEMLSPFWGVLSQLRGRGI